MHYYYLQKQSKNVYRISPFIPLYGVRSFVKVIPFALLIVTLCFFVSILLGYCSNVWTRSAFFMFGR